MRNIIRKSIAGMLCVATCITASVDTYAAENIHNFSSVRLQNEQVPQYSTEIETQLESRSDMKTNTETSAESEVKSNLETETNIQTKTITEIETNTTIETSDAKNIESEIELTTELETKTNTQTKLEIETSTETQSESSSIIEIETETQNETSTSIDTETETNTELETETLTELETETEIETSTFIETETETSTETQSESSSIIETETETQIETSTSIETDTEANTELETETLTEREIETEIETELETETLTEPETKANLTETQIKEAEQRVKDELNQKMESDGYVFSGYIDSGMEAQPLEQEASLFSIRNNLPDRYSVVEDGQDTAIKDQGDWGACWSFAAIAPAESTYKKETGKEVNLSEPHLINFFYNENIEGPDGGLEGDKVIPLMAEKVNNGGNSMFTTFALARWTGIADERTHSSMVYPSADQTKLTKELNIPQEYAYTDLVHLRNAYWINKSNTDSIKEMILKYGAVAASYKHSESRSSNYVEGYDGPTVYYNDYNEGGNHAIAIVGWDDNFDKNNFKYTAINQDPVFLEAEICFIPKNNGAWLIKNSWGESYGDDGYFWMSYEEASLANTIFAFEYEGADNYDHIYQYDGSVGVRYESDDTITAAVVYQSTGNQVIEAVGIGIKSIETDYEIEIYTGLTDASDPQSGALSVCETGTTVFEGYHTIALEKYATVAEGELFSVVITLSNGQINGEEGAAIFIDQSYINAKAVEFVAKSNPGETFFQNENGWQDAASKGTYRIKAYTSDGEFDVPQENRQLTTEMVREIAPQEYNGTQNEPEIDIHYMDETLVKDIDYTVTYSNNTFVGDKETPNAPKAVITGIGKYTGTVEQTFTIFPKTITEEMVESTALSYNGAVQDDLVLQNGFARLRKDIDYTIVYNKQPCNAGKYTADITGINNYVGQMRITVTIGKTVLSEEMISIASTAEDSTILSDGTLACTFTGSAIKPFVKVTVFGAEVPTKSYSVAYKQNTNVGTATITVTGKGNCQGKVTKTFQIVPKNITSDFTVTIAKATFADKALTPTVSVKWNKKTLKKNKDYTVTYENNIMAAGLEDTDAPKAIVRGIGNYTGELAQTFAIAPKQIAESSISVQIVYNGPDSTIRVLVGKTELVNKEEANKEEQNGEIQYKAVLYKAGTTTKVEPNALVLGEKYDVEITLFGNYQVKNKPSALKKNIVSKRDINSLTVDFTEKDSVLTYNGKAQKPKLTITDENGKTIAASNYTIVYANNMNAGEAKAIITGKGSYAGSRSLNFTIHKKKLDSTAIQPIKDQTYTQKELRPTVKVLDGKKVLKAGVGRDYTYEYGNNINVSYENDGSVAAKAFVKIQMSNNYEIIENKDTLLLEGDHNKTIDNNADENIMFCYFKIKPASLSAITLSNAYYTKQEVLPEKITIKAGKLVVPVEDCNITAVNNTQVSSGATLTVTAKPNSNYTGSKTKRYSVVKRELKRLQLPIIPDQPYLKKPITVENYRILDLQGQEVAADQYDITIKNNNKPGKATVTYKAKSDGIYKGSATVKFNITKATMQQAVDFAAAQTIEKQYTGEALTLTDAELRQFAPIKDAEEWYALPYTVDYSKNINAGKAVVILTGTDYLQGSTRLTFTITPKSANSFVITTGTKQLSYNNGTPVRLELKEIKDQDSGAVLRAGRDYTCSYINADKRGLACLTITGVGNYSGTRYIYYRIE